MFSLTPAHAAEAPPSAEQIRASLVLPGGLAAELVACEPQIASPVAMAFDENGVLFVVEMLDYPTLARDAPPAGRIKRLEDRDGDGRYEHASVFAEGLAMANGLLPWNGGLLVTSAPHILFLKDADGDGVSEARERVFDGFAVTNSQLRSSHPTLGLDNFIYVTNGARGGTVKRAGVDGAPSIALGSQDFRFAARDLRGGVYEAVAGYGQFGLAFDDWGQRFVCTNRNHWVHLPMESRYFARNPNLAAPPALRDDQKPGGSAKVFPLSRNKTLASSHAGSFTAACGVYVYRGTALPEVYRGAIFTCEPSGNLVHGERLIPDGATFRGQPLFEGKEFLASSENWFRPVNLGGGPDGALYVVDMCRADVEHPEWVPKHLQHRYDFEGVKDRGRIWRIVSKDVPSRCEKPALRGAPLETLVGALERPDDWWRTTAQRLLLERGDRAASPALQKMAATNPLPQARLHALWLLEALGALDAATLQTRLGDAHPRVREGALRLAEPFLARTTGPLNESVSACIVDGDARVRFQTALTLGAWRNEALLNPLAEIARRDGGERWTRLAVVSSAAEFPERLLEYLDAATHPELLRELGLLIGASKDFARISTGLLALKAREFPTRSALLLGMADGLARRGERLERSLEKLDAEPRQYIQSLVRDARRLLAQPGTPLGQRVLAARVSMLDQEPDIQLLTALLGREQPEALQLATLAALEHLPAGDVAEELLPRVKSLLPGVRREALRILSAQPKLAAALLGALEAKKLQRMDLDSETVRRLKNSADAGVRERALALLKDPAAGERLALLQRYKAALGGAGDAKAGRAHFEQNCAACHRIGARGITVGPDISDTLGRDAEALLNDILVPNAAIDTSFTAYLVKTKQGVVHTGLIAAQSATSITLRGAGGTEETILLQDAADVRSTGQSLMPEGLEAALTPEQMRDLIAYIRNWRDVEGK